MNNPPKISDKTFSWRDGKQWFISGVALFKQVKNHWYINCLLLAVLVSLLASIALPLVSVVIIFATPLMTAFIMTACQKVTQNKPLNFAAIWQQVMLSIQGLVILGVLSALFSVLAHLVHTQLLNILNLPVELTEEMAKNMTLNEAVVRSLLNVMTNLPIAMALAFAPALILFKNIAPISAVKFSFIGVVKSWKAFLALTIIFMLVFFGVLILSSVIMAMMMAVLGGASQMLITVVVMFFAVTVAGIGLCAQYQAYTDVFQDEVKVENHNDDETEVYAEI